MNINKREKLIIAVIFLVVISFFASQLIPIKNKNNEENENITSIKSLEESENSELVVENDDKDIYVHICGRVKNPGLIQLPANSRVVDAVEKAGGLYEDADYDKINLAKILKDEDRIYIAKTNSDLETTFNDEKENDIQGSLININTATKEELQQLPGIGPKMAENIIEFRESENFDEIVDIMRVTGIGEKKFEDLKKIICTN